VRASWLVNADAEEGRDYDIDRLSWLWGVTTIQDGDITMDNQKGVNSRFYQPGLIASANKAPLVLPQGT